MKKSRILEEMHEPAWGLHHIGVLHKQTMREFDALTIAPVHSLSERQIRAIRSRARMRYAVFAAARKTSTSMVQKWEIGANRTAGPSL